MMRRLDTVFTGFFFLVLVGCSSENIKATPVDTQPIEQETQNIATFTPNKTDIANQPNLFGAETPLSSIAGDSFPLQFPTPFPGTLITQQCVRVREFDSTLYKGEGKLIINTKPLDDLFTEHDAKFLYLSNGLTQTITNKSIPDGKNIAPDRNKFFVIDVLEDENYDKLYVEDFEGTNLMTANWPKFWGNDAEWLDDNTIIVFPPRSDNYIYGTAILIEPLEGKNTILIPPFTELLNIDRLVISYSPTLKYAFYYSSGFYSFFDLGRNENIFDLGITDLSYEPVWNSTGETVYYGIYELGLDSHSVNDLYSFNIKDGRKKLTSLKDSYGGEGNNIWSISVSPDETKVAIQYSVNYPNKNYQSPALGILDLRTKQLFDTCLVPAIEDVYWSPNGTQLAITVPVDMNQFLEDRTKNVKKEANVVIIDLNTWKGWRFRENGAVTGWIEN